MSILERQRSMIQDEETFQNIENLSITGVGLNLNLDWQ